MPASPLVGYARLLRPFPAKRLADTLHQVQASGHVIDKRLMRLMLDPPATPELWRFELDMLAGDLHVLAEQCAEARTRVEVMAVDADRAFASAVDAMTLALRGAAAEARETAA